MTKLIFATQASIKPDSPVYTYLPNLSAPQLKARKLSDLVEEVKSLEENLSRYLDAGQKAMRHSDFPTAVQAFSDAASLRPDDSYIIQQLALATYKSKSPTAIAALAKGLEIINRLDPDNSNDPETLGIAGAIHKRRWEATKERGEIDAAIRHYERGFKVRGDYYNGENLATCFDLRAATQSNRDEALFDRMSARKVREALMIILDNIRRSPNFSERSDAIWVYATSANVCLALGRRDEAVEHENAFFCENPAQWEIDAYSQGKATALAAGAPAR